MGYPTGVFAFTTKQDGVDYPQAAHINDLQNEVTAIETALITGPLQLGASSVTSLSVSGGSTVAALNVNGALNVAGNSSVANLNVSGDSSIAGDLYVAKMPPSVRVTNSTATAVLDGATVTMNWNTQTWISTSAMHSTTTTPSRLKPPSSGLYWLAAGVEYPTNSSGGIRGAYIVIDGSSLVIRQQVPGSTTNPTDLNLSGPYRFASTSQFAELVLFQTGLATVNVNVIADYTPWFSMTKIR